MTPKRFNRIRSVVEKRQKHLTVVLENIHDPHNVSAILRTADAVGVDKVYLIYNTNKFPKIGRTSSASAKKWIGLERFADAAECIESLRKDKYRIYSTHINNDVKKNISLYDLDLTARTALVFGNEHTGVSQQLVDLSDKNFMIPMYGMIQSLNVSVAVAVCLYESLRQREVKGLYEKTGFTKKEISDKLKDYCNR